MITAVVSTALSVVREKERGTMEQVRMAPIGAAAVHRRQDAAVLRHLAGLGARHHLRRDGAVRPADARLVAAAARCRCRCSWSARSGMGLLISTVADSQQVAFQVALLVVVPADDDAVRASSSRSPACRRSLQVVTYIVPARYFLVALRGDRAEGRRASTSFWPQLAALAIFAVVVLALASRAAADGSGPDMRRAPAT